MTDNELRDKVAADIHTGAILASTGIGDLPDRERKVTLEAVALLAYEAADALVRTRRLFLGGQR
jgi:hypothetical protein